MGSRSHLTVHPFDWMASGAGSRTEVDRHMIGGGAQDPYIHSGVGSSPEPMGSYLTIHPSDRMASGGGEWTWIG